MDRITLSDRDPRYVDISCLVRDWSGVKEGLGACKTSIGLDTYCIKLAEKKLEVHLGIFVEACRLFHVNAKEIFPILYEQAKERLGNLHNQLLVTEDNIRLLARRIADIDEVKDDSSAKELLKIERKLSRIELRAMLKFTEVVRESQHQQRISAR